MSSNLAVNDAVFGSEYLDSDKTRLNTVSALIHTYLNLKTITHSVCNYQAIQILKNDGWCREADLITKYSDQIDMGTSWADSNWRSFSHCYNPVTKRGYFNSSSAVEECRKYYHLAKSYILRQRFARAFFYLGAALHLVQDLCVPHHSHNVMFKGHQRFEKWTEAHVENYLVFKNCIYKDSLKDPGDWVIDNSQASFDLYSLTNNTSLRDYHLAAKVMFPHAQRTSAGFLLFFLESAFH